MFVQVAVADIVYKIDKLYDYRLTMPLTEDVIGRRVYVPFGKTNALHKAIIMSVSETTEHPEYVKDVDTVLDTESVVTPSQLEMIEFIHSQYFVTRYQALKLMIPQGLDYTLRHAYVKNHQYEGDESIFAPLWSLFPQKGKLWEKNVSLEFRPLLKKAIEAGAILESVDHVRNIGDLAEKWVGLNMSLSEAEERYDSLPKRMQKQKDVLALFFDQPQWPVKEVMYLTGCSVSTIQTLLKKEWLHLYYQPILRDPYQDLQREENISPLQLSDEQSTVCNELLSSLDATGNVHLLHGVTGSGKTHVFMRMIDEMVERHRSVLYLVPEISLTPQLVRKFFLRYGDKVAVIHSGLSMGERLDEWKKIKNSPSTLVIGTRSAIFAPIQNLGMIIMDEEHEGSYKSESAPKYHAKDVARFLAKQSKAMLLLASATPSLESFRMAERGKWKLHSLKTRFNKQPLPEVVMVDMRENERVQGDGFISDTLFGYLKETLEREEQAILFLNRRGAHTVIRCAACGYVETCPNCGISLTYHSKNDRCICHYCGYSISVPTECPTCHDQHIRMTGMGTQLAEQKLSELFPSAKILRMDMDTVMSYRSYQNMLRDFENKKYDIMLGTQMVAKGLDFANVTLVGVLNADMSLYIEDFRAGERTFSMLTQVCGRSGRSDKPGRAVIQTYCPEHEVLYYAKHQDYLSYYEYEIQFRKTIMYPPFCDIALFSITAPEFSAASAAANDLFDEINDLAKQREDLPIRLLRPTVPRITKSGGRYRMQLIVKCKNTLPLRNLLRQATEKIQKGSIKISVDINPLNFS